MVMKRSGKDWFRNEAEVMELLGFKQVPGSGSSWIAREDGENEHALCQLKSTDAQSIRVQLQDIHELQVNAAVAHKMPVFAIQFRRSNEVFLLVSPLDAGDLSDYIRHPTGKLEPFNKEPLVVDELDAWQPPRSVASSKSARDRFARENEKKFTKKEKRAR